MDVSAAPCGHPPRLGDGLTNDDSVVNFRLVGRGLDENWTRWCATPGGAGGLAARLLRGLPVVPGLGRTGNRELRSCLQPVIGHDDGRHYRRHHRVAAEAESERVALGIALLCHGQGPPVVGGIGGGELLSHAVTVGSPGRYLKRDLFTSRMSFFHRPRGTFGGSSRAAGARCDARPHPTSRPGNRRFA